MFWKPHEEANGCLVVSKLLKLESSIRIKWKEKKKKK